MKTYLGTYFGTPLYLHWSWYLFMFVITLLYGWFQGVVFLAVFLFVILHEYGHCIVAQQFKMLAKDITIYPLGGLAIIQFKNDDPFSELCVALAGPAVNFALAFFFVCLLLLNMVLPLHSDFVIVAEYGTLLNVVLGIFNLLPIFPMDGGRVLRAILNGFIDYTKATWLAVRFGQISCMVLIVISAICSMWMTMAIFLLMAVAAQGELMTSRAQHSLQKIKEKLALATNRPELRTAELPEVIVALESLEEPQRTIFQVDVLLPMLQQMQETSR